MQLRSIAGWKSHCLGTFNANEAEVHEVTWNQIDCDLCLYVKSVKRTLFSVCYQTPSLQPFCCRIFFQL